jgi:hypothetical protein
MPPISELKQSKHDGTMVVGSTSASMYYQGGVYNLMYEWDNPARMHPSDVLRINWDSLSLSHVFDYGHANANWMLLIFTQRMDMHHYPSGMISTESVFIRLSTRKETMRRLVNERRAKKAAFVMAAHGRLGEGSPARVLDPELVQLVCRFV